MSDEDVQDLVAFMRTVPAVDNEIPERELNFPVEAYTPRAAAPATAPTAGVERGSYIANAIAHCGDCHTPRTATGAPDMSKMLAGAIIEGAVAPNLTPDEATGIGSWSEEEIATLLQTGVEPSGKKVEGLMALLIEGGYKDMTDDDALAVAAYLKSVPAVENEVELPAAEVAEEAAPAEESAPAATPPTTLPVSGDENVTLPFALLLSVLGGASLLAGFILYRRQHQA
jgi:mono/diheme cytochrome c family protein